MMLESMWKCSCSGDFNAIISSDYTEASSGTQEPPHKAIHQDSSMTQLLAADPCLSVCVSMHIMGKTPGMWGQTPSMLAQESIKQGPFSLITPRPHVSRLADHWVKHSELNQRAGVAITRFRSSYLSWFILPLLSLLALLLSCHLCWLPSSHLPKPHVHSDFRSFFFEWVRTSFKQP